MLLYVKGGLCRQSATPLATLKKMELVVFSADMPGLTAKTLVQGRLQDNKESPLWYMHLFSENFHQMAAAFCCDEAFRTEDPELSTGAPGSC